MYHLPLDNTYKSIANNIYTMQNQNMQSINPQQGKEAIITIVGFLGAGKTSLLKYLNQQYRANNWQTFILLKDYENAEIDAYHFTEQINAKTIKTLSGSCICCSGIHVLRDFVNEIPARKQGIT